MWSPELLTALGQSVGMVVIVVLFLSHMKMRDTEWRKAFDRNSEVLGRVLERLRK